KGSHQNTDHAINDCKYHREQGKQGRTPQRIQLLQQGHGIISPKKNGQGSAATSPPHRGHRKEGHQGEGMTSGSDPSAPVTAGSLLPWRLPHPRVCPLQKKPPAWKIRTCADRRAACRASASGSHTRR